MVSAQSNDALDRPLSTYTYATARFLHVQGVNIEVLDVENYFDNLLNGTELPPISQIYLPIPREKN